MECICVITIHTRNGESERNKEDDEGKTKMHFFGGMNDVYFHIFFFPLPFFSFFLFFFLFFMSGKGTKDKQFATVAGAEKEILRLLSSLEGGTGNSENILSLLSEFALQEKSDAQLPIELDFFGTYLKALSWFSPSQRSDNLQRLFFRVANGGVALKATLWSSNGVIFYIQYFLFLNNENILCFFLLSLKVEGNVFSHVLNLIAKQLEHFSY